MAVFEKAVNAPDAIEEDFITALNDWRPVNQKVRRKKESQGRGKMKLEKVDRKFAQVSLRGVEELRSYD